MSILSTIFTALTILTVALPIGAHFSGQGLSNTPIASQKIDQNCSGSQKPDKYGRCPKTNRSSFRYLSIGGGSRTGGAGGSK